MCIIVQLSLWFLIIFSVNGFTDVHPPSFVILVDKCMNNSNFIDSIDELKSEVHHNIVNLTNNKCWEFDFFDYDISYVYNCTPDGLLTQIEMAFDSNIEKKTIVVTDDCHKLIKIEKMVDSFMKNRLLIAMLEYGCPEVYNFEVFKIVSLTPKANSVYFPMTYFEDIKPYKYAVQVVFIYQEDYFYIDPSNVVKHCSKNGLRTQILKVEEINNKLIADMATNKEGIQIYVACNSSETASLLLKFGKFGLLEDPSKTWVIYTRESLPYIQYNYYFKIRYNSKLIVVQTRDMNQDMTLEDMLKLSLEYTNSESIRGYKCSICEYRGIAVAYFRLSYSHNEVTQVNYQCSAIINNWSKVRYVHSTSSVWSPEHLTMTGKHFKMTTLVDPPYLQMDEEGKYFGYFIELLDILKQTYNFTYSLSEPKDKQYGRLVKGKWTGMIRELYDNNAEFALGAFQVTKERTEIVKYAKHNLFNANSKLIYRKSNGGLDSTFQTRWKSVYTRPFHIEVWLFIIATIILCSLALTLIESVYISKDYGDKAMRKQHYTSYDTTNFFVNPFDNLLYMYSALLQQGWDKTPDRVPSRILVISFRIFCIIMYAGYSAIIISQYIVEKPPEPFSDMNDLVKNRVYKIGTVEGTYYLDFLKKHRRQAWDYMQEDDSNILTNFELLADKVLKDNIVGIYDAISINSFVSRNCSFGSIPEANMGKVSTFTFSKDSPYNDAFSDVLELLDQNGVMKRLQRIWFYKNTCAQQSVDNKKTEQDSITLMQTTVPFSSVLSGIIAGFIFLAFEFVCKRVKGNFWIMDQ